MLICLNKVFTGVKKSSGIVKLLQYQYNYITPFFYDEKRDMQMLLSEGKCFLTNDIVIIY